RGSERDGLTDRRPDAIERAGRNPVLRRHPGAATGDDAGKRQVIVQVGRADAAGRHERKPGERRRHGFQVLDAADLLGWKQLDELQSALRASFALWGSAAAGEFAQVLFASPLVSPAVGSGKDDEAGAAPLAREACSGLSTAPAPTSTSGRSAAIRRSASAA